MLCEEWPYAAHLILERLDQTSPVSMPYPNATREVPMMRLYNQATSYSHSLSRFTHLDGNYDDLRTFITAHLLDLTEDDLRRLRFFTVNFNPALTAAIRQS